MFRIYITYLIFSFVFTLLPATSGLPASSDSDGIVPPATTPHLRGRAPVPGAWSKLNFDPDDVSYDVRQCDGPLIAADELVAPVRDCNNAIGLVRETWPSVPAGSTASRPGRIYRSRASIPAGEAYALNETLPQMFISGRCRITLALRQNETQTTSAVYLGFLGVALTTLLEACVSNRRQPRGYAPYDWPSGMVIMLEIAQESVSGVDMAWHEFVVNMARAELDGGLVGEEEVEGEAVGQGLDGEIVGEGEFDGGLVGEEEVDGEPMGEELDGGLVGEEELDGEPMDEELDEEVVGEVVQPDEGWELRAWALLNRLRNGVFRISRYTGGPGLPPIKNNVPGFTLLDMRIAFARLWGTQPEPIPPMATPPPPPRTSIAMPPHGH